MKQYYCPNCGATLDDQVGFDSSCGFWTCTSCGQFLCDDDVYEGDLYEGVAWFCDNCGSLLNRQSGFSDVLGSWICTDCGCENGTTEDDIIQKEDKGSQCPNCSSYLKKQVCYIEYENDWDCTECGVHLHRDYSFESYSIVEKNKGPLCPNCSSSLKKQTCFTGYDDEWKCTECGAHLYYDYCFDTYVVVNNNDIKKENNTDDKNKQTTPSTSTTNSYFKNYYKYEERKTEKELHKKRVKAFIFRHKKINIEYGSNELIGQDIETVNTLLHNQAFNHIKMIPIKDIYVDSPYRVGQVERVIINGNSNFSYGDKISYDAEIILKYHEKKEIIIPFSDKSLYGINYKIVREKLQKLGFTEIYEQPIRDLVTGWLKKDGSVEKVIIDSGYRFKKNSSLKYDIKILIEYHTFKNK